MQVPDFVLRTGYNLDDWIPEHDFLQERDGHNLPSNQLKWWITNVRIRRALKQIEIDVDRLLTQKKSVKIHIVSDSNISKISKVSRVSISHPMRSGWINKQSDLIKATIFAARVELQDQNEILDLNEKLILARKESFVWYNKALSLEKKIESLNNIISALKKELNSGNGSNNSRFLQ